jgi:hypothetical protein
MNASIAQALMDTLAALDDEIAAAQTTVDRLMLERQGVETALRRFGYTSPTSPVTRSPAIPGPAGDKQALPSDVRPRQTGNAALTSRVLDTLVTSGAPMRVGEVAELLDLDITQVRSAVAYLHRKHRVSNPRRGFWQAIVDTETVSASTETNTVSATPLLPRQKGGDARGPGFDFDRAPWHGHRAPVGS